MLGQRRRRWANIETTLVTTIIFGLNTGVDKKIHNLTPCNHDEKSENNFFTPKNACHICLSLLYKRICHRLQWRSVIIEVYLRHFIESINTSSFVLTHTSNITQSRKGVSFLHTYDNCHDYVIVQQSRTGDNYHKYVKRHTFIAFFRIIHIYFEKSDKYWK